MNENQFLAELKHYLKKIPKDERDDMIGDYKEHFSIGKGEGKSEEDISDALGSPHKIAKELLAMYHLERAKNNTTVGNVFRATWAGIAIGFFNLIIVFTPFIAVTAIVLAGWIIGVTFIASPLLAVVNSILLQEADWFQFFFSLFISGIGIFVFMGVLSLTKKMMDGFMRYLKFNLSLVKGGLK